MAWSSWEKAETTLISGELKVQDAREQGMMGVVVVNGERPPVIEAEMMHQHQANKLSV